MSRPNAEPSPLPGGAAARPSWGAWLAAAIGAACFLNSVWNDFAYDDLAIVKDNLRIRSPGKAAEIWLSDWWQPQDPDQEVSYRRRDRLYRPLTMCTFALNYAVGGLGPAGYHAVNVALHAVVCLLVWRLAQRLFSDAAISNCAALLFAVHPVHCEAVANVVGRAEVLAALFLLLGMLVLLPAGRPPGWQRATGAAALFLAALFSKETAVCYVPVALLGLHFAAKRPGQSPAATVGPVSNRSSRWQTLRWWLMHMAILLAPLIVYLPLRYVALDHHLLRDKPPHVLMNPLVWADAPHRWLHALTILGHYARLLIAPASLSCNYGLAVLDADRGAEPLTVVGGLVVVVAAVALVGYARPSGVWRRLAVLTAITIASYVLISNTVLLIGVSLAERLMYWPSVPILLAITVGVVHLWRRAIASGRLSAEGTRLLRICGVLLLVVFGLHSVVRDADWSSNRTLFGRDVGTFPRSAELNKSWAKQLLLQIDPSTPWPDARRLFDQAEQHLKTALEIHPRFQEAMQLRGRLYALFGDRARAIEYLEMATRLGPLDRVSMQLLGQLRDEGGKDAARVAELAEQVSTRPTDAALRIEYGGLLLRHGHYREALAELEEAVRLAPDDARALRLLGEACGGMNERERATQAFQRAVAIDPGDWRVHVNLATLLVASDPAAALRHAQQARSLAPTGLETNLTLAEVLAVNGRLDEALKLFRRIERSLPDDAPMKGAVQSRIRDLELGRP